MVVKIRDYDSPYYPIAIEVHDKGRMVYQDVFPACMSDSEIRSQINALWYGYSFIVRDLRKNK